MAITASELTSQRVFDPEVYGNGDPTTFGLPLDLYDRMREEEPLVKLALGHELLVDEVWVASRHADIWAIDKDPETFAANRGLVNIWKFAPLDPVHKPAMLVQDGEEHRATRGMVGKAFRPNVVARLAEKFRAYAVEVVEAAIAKREFDFITEIAHEMPMQALGDVLGVPAGDRPKFFSWVDTFASPFDTRVTPSFEKVAQAITELYEYALELHALKQREPGDDVMTKVAQANLTPDAIQGNVALLASGAAESTRSALGHGMHELMRNPEQMRWIMERADDIPPTAVQEMVRIATPFTHLVRTATRDVEMHGEVIKEGDKVAMLFASGNFDPEGIPDPRTFDLSRDPNEHLSFGRGPHSCLGKHVAALEIKILLEELFQRIEYIRPAGPISYTNDNYARGVYSLPVEVKGA
jgi:cholest-4-en-3-one 26-monooxygenase